MLSPSSEIPFFSGISPVLTACWLHLQSSFGVIVPDSF